MTKVIDQHRDDRMLRQAMERNFEIVGEAIKRLVQSDPETAARIGDYRTRPKAEVALARYPPLNIEATGAARLYPAA